MGEAKVVWILGAGFSRSLGGPLLDDLLQPDCLRRLHATFPRDDFPQLHGAIPSAAVWLYHYGRRFSQGRRSERAWEGSGEALWRDAEEFLDFVESAATSPKGPADSTLQSILSHSQEELLGRGNRVPGALELRTVARRLIAAECTAFLRDVDLETERWGPYQRWATELVKLGDRVVSFNYDVAVEHLCKKVQHLEVMVPGKAGLNWAPVLKVHGSVNWRRIPTEAGSRYEETDLDSAVCCTCDDQELAIATPGRTKSRYAKELSELWDEATSAIRQADAVVFLGYRFPPSDAEARRQVLGAIRGNDNTYLVIHTVLGPDVRSPDSARLVGLLHHATGHRWPSKVSNALRRADVIQQPLFVEDFLSIVERVAITAPTEQPGLRGTNFG